MTKYISILRGINVSGKRKILMGDLKALYEKMGFENIQTYIQSGNVVFENAKKINNKKLEVTIKKAIQDQYNFDVPVLVRSHKEIENTIQSNPFLKEKDIDLKTLHVTFLAESPKAENLDKLDEVDYPPDRFLLDGLNMYIHCPNGYGRTKLTNTFFEKKLKVSATTRNWKTVNKLLEMGA